MSLVNNPPFNARLLHDVNFVSNVANATSASTAFDLVQAVPYPVTEQVVFNLLTDVLSSSLGATASFTLQDSADGTTFANIAVFAAPIATSKVAVGIAPLSASVLLPPTVRRYVRVSGSCLSASVASTLDSGGYTASLAF